MQEDRQASEGAQREQPRIVALVQVRVNGERELAQIEKLNGMTGKRESGKKSSCGKQCLGEVGVLSVWILANYNVEVIVTLTARTGIP